MNTAPESWQEPNQHLARDVVRDVVAKVAPEELPLVDGLRTVEYRAAVRRLSRGRTRREPLGFGLDEVAGLVTAVVWIAVDEAVRASIGTVVDGAKRRTTSRLRALLHRRAPDPVVPPLTSEQLAVVHSRVRELCMQAGINAERAGQIADSVVARLALTASNEESGLEER